MPTRPPIPFARATMEWLERRTLFSAAFDVTDLTAFRNDASLAGIDGSGVGIAVLDTGIYASNPDLSGNVVAYYDAVASAVPTSIDGSSLARAADAQGHGTHVAGTAASTDADIGVAYAADIVSVKVIDDGANSSRGGDPLLRGLQFVERFADQYNIKVVNLSLGQVTQSGGVNLNRVPNADDVSRQIDVLEALGITVVSASGNSYANDPKPGASSPAVVSTISVASTWADDGAGHAFGTYATGSAYDRFAAFERSADADRFSATSQRSTLANQVAAPGVDIYSTWNGSGAGDDLLHNTLSGTSMATPFVSGLVALIQDAAVTYGGQYFSDVNQVLDIVKETSDVIVDGTVSTNGRIRVSNGAADTSTTFDLPETGESFFRVNVLNAITYVRNLFGGATPGTEDADDTADAAAALPALTGTREYTRRGTIGRDGLNEVGAADVDLYALTLGSPGTVAVAITRPTGAAPFAGTVRLFNDGGAEIARADSVNGSYPTLTFGEASPLATGTYFVGISGIGNDRYAVADGANKVAGNGTGEYVLRVGLSNPDPNGVAQGAVNVDMTDPNATLPNMQAAANRYNGSIGSDPPIGSSAIRTAVPDGDVDMFKVVAPDTGTLTVQTTTAAYGAAGVDSYVSLLDAGLTEILANDDRSSTNRDSFASIRVAAGQTYYVAVTNYDNRAFDARNPYGRLAGSTASERSYDLYLSFDNGDADGTALLATAATVGGSVDGAIGSDAGVALAGANGGHKDVDFYAYAAPAAGLLEVSVEADDASFTPTLQLWTLTADRTSINKVADTTGEGGGVIVPVAAGQTVYASVTGLGNNNFKWYALGSGSGGQTGAYGLTSTLRPAADRRALSDDSVNAGTPGVLSLGAAVSAELGTDGPLVAGTADVDLYAFVPAAAGAYEFRTDTSTEGSADTVLRLFDARGAELAANDNASDRTTGSTVRHDLAAGATYYVGVSGSGERAAAYNPITGANAAAGSTGAYVLIATTPSAGADVGTPAPVPPAADLAITLDAGRLPGTLAPLDRGVVRFTLTNAGDASLRRATVTTEIRLSADATYDAGDVLIGTATVRRLSLNVGQAKAFTARVVIPGGQSAGAYHVVALTDAAAGIDEKDESNNAAAETAPRPLRWAFGTFDGRRRASLTLPDASGAAVTFTLRGAGSGEVTRGADGLFDVSFVGTTTRTAVAIAARGGGVEGRPAVDDVAIAGDLRSIAARTVELVGQIVTTGVHGRLAFADEVIESTLA